MISSNQYHGSIEQYDSELVNLIMLWKCEGFFSGFFHNLWQVGRGCQASSFFNDTFRLRRAGDLKDATCALTNCCPITFVEFFQDLSINEDSIASPYDVQRTNRCIKYRMFSCKWCYDFSMVYVVWLSFQRNFQILKDEESTWLSQHWEGWSHLSSMDSMDNWRWTRWVGRNIVQDLRIGFTCGIRRHGCFLAQD